jgi:magnesium transporter
MLSAGRRRSKKTSLPPGTLVHVGEKRTEKVKITVIDYDSEGYEEMEIETCEECFPYKEKPTVTWINVDGIDDAAVVRAIGDKYGLHPLLQEDVMNAEQRPKTEDFGEYIFVVLKMFYQDDRSGDINIEQVSMVLGSNFVISFQEREGDVFNAIRERIRERKGRIREMGPDYLAYTLIDAIVDGYFLILERIGDEIGELEEGLVFDPRPLTLQAIHNLKTDIIFLRRSVWPLREVVHALERRDSALIRESTVVFLRDVYDHTIQVIDTIETYRDMISSMRDTYLSSMSNRMNEVMKVLTIFASIFIPLTFFAGIYGMNFRYMPELEWRWSYPVLIGVLAGIGVSMLLLFKRRRWL